MNRKYIIFMILLIGLAFRVLVGVYLGFNEISPSDGYETIAEHLLITGKFEKPSIGTLADRAPLFILAISLIYYLFSVNIIYVKILNILLSVASIFIVFILTKEIFNNRKRYLTIAIMAFNPLLIGMSSSLMSENMFMFFIILHVIYLIKFLDIKTVRYIVFSTIFLGLATLTRSVGLLYGIFWSAFILYYVIRKKINIKNLIVFLGIYMFILLPWTIRNYYHLGKIIPITTNSGRVFWESNNPYILDDPINWGRTTLGNDPPEVAEFNRLPEIERDEAFRKLSIEYLRNNISDIPRLIINKHMRFWNPFPNLDSKLISIMVSFYFLPQIVLFIFGVIKGIMKKNNSILILIVMIILMNISALIYWGGGRIRMPVEPFIIIVAVYGIRALSDYWNLLKYK